MDFSSIGPYCDTSVDVIELQPTDAYSSLDVTNITYNLYIFFPLVLQPTFGPWPTSMKLSVSL
jgi:hypothetical protein